MSDGVVLHIVVISLLIQLDATLNVHPLQLATSDKT